MDLSKVPNEKKLYLCKWYFKAGFCFLPIIWIVNTVWFFSEAFRKPAFDEQKSIKKYVILSGIGSLLWISVLTVWIVLYQLNRTNWGDLGDDITFVIPLGEP